MHYTPVSLFLESTYMYNFNPCNFAGAKARKERSHRGALNPLLRVSESAEEGHTGETRSDITLL